MKLVATTQRRILMITMPMVASAIATIFLMSGSVPTFAYHASRIITHPEIQPVGDTSHNYVVNRSNNSEQQLMQMQSPSKVIEASRHFANNQIENDSVSWIQGGLWHLAVYNSSLSSSNDSTAAKAIFSGNFTMVKPDGSDP
ncbi:MAG: hypothetical protein ACJ72X_02075 [Nitrososphaeraceae archaeon]